MRKHLHTHGHSSLVKTPDKQKKTKRTTHTTYRAYRQTDYSRCVDSLACHYRYIRLKLELPRSTCGLHLRCNDLRLIGFDQLLTLAGLSTLQCTIAIPMRNRTCSQIAQNTNFTTKTITQIKVTICLRFRIIFHEMDVHKIKTLKSANMCCKSFRPLGHLACSANACPACLACLACPGRKHRPAL